MKITVIEDMGYGSFKTDIGDLTWDFDTNGIDGILVQNDNDCVYKVLSDERDDNDNVIAFIVEE